MNDLSKIKFSAYIDGIKSKFIKLYNIFLFKKYKLTPIDKYSIVLESEGDCCDNAYALYDYIKNNGYLNKYKVTWLVEYPENFQPRENVYYVKKNIYNSFSKKTIVALSSCHWYIYDHCDILNKNKKKDQKIIFLNHGGGFKAASNIPKSYADETYTPSKLFYYPASVCWGCPIEKIYDLEFPGLDYFFKENNDKQNKLIEKLHINNYKSVFLWMPTFRKSISKNLSEDYFVSETGLPILYKEEELKELDELLKNHNSLCVFKVHHLQAELKVFSEEYSNILIFNDNVINEFDLQLYEFIKLTSCLITDYSSISTDYMLLNRPIIYTMDDYDEYKNSRGFSIDNPAQYFAGYHIYNKSQLFEAIREVSDGKDFYKKDRMELLPILHSHIDGNASIRILDHLEITVKEEECLQ